MSLRFNDDSVAFSRTFSGKDAPDREAVGGPIWPKSKPQWHHAEQNEPQGGKYSGETPLATTGLLPVGDLNLPLRGQTEQSFLPSAAGAGRLANGRAGYRAVTGDYGPIAGEHPCNTRLPTYINSQSQRLHHKIQS